MVSIQEKNHMMRSVNLSVDFSFLKKSPEDQFLTKCVTFHEYNDGDLICNGSQFDNPACYIIASGAVQIIRPVIKNKSIMSYFLEQGHVFGIENIFMQNELLPLIVSAKGNVGLYCIDKEDLMRQCEDIQIFQALFKCYIKSVNYAMVC